MGKKKVITLFTMIVLPVFLSISFEDIKAGFSNHGFLLLGKGIFFNATYWLRYKFQTLPLSQFIILFMALRYSQYLIGRKRLWFFLALSIPSLYLVLLYGSHISYHLKILIQTMNFLIAIEIFRKFIPIDFTKKDLIKSVYSSLFIVCGLKLVFDVLFSWQLVSWWFMFRSIQIYNIAGYFPIVYLILTYYSFSMIKEQKYPVSKAVVIMTFVLSFVCLFTLQSRLYQLMVILTPLFLFTPKLDTKVEKRIYALIFFISILIPISYLNLMFFWKDLFPGIQLDHSMTVRSRFIDLFFSNLNWSEIIFPSISKGLIYFTSGGRSLHNEHMAIYSCLGLPFFIVFIGYLSSIIKKIYFTDRYLGCFFLALLFFGGCIQLTFLQSYSGILSGALLGSFLKIYENNMSPNRISE